ncbi:PREDICTED: heme-binding protein 1-like [Amphimedon queenslandica]|uniref:Heme-binding protein 2-like n=1 Tax=Amphimedon queenslandica TaxID=400682 RepID=A0A1X7VM97_AMPQE|nr:PREDICTED: heme-binding protein 1-like [Amphimedon queenslandica]|eukprot:XP_003383651.1 PREDICTED: heme-binding protein 1-like [Amphimedon queenslandica]
MKMKFLVVLAALITLSLAASIRDEPSFCHGLDCPKYTVTRKIDDYEERQYEPSKWVGTTITSDSYSQATEEGFKKLFDYIEGANKDGIKIPMASPVAVKIVPLPQGQSNYTVLFFVPFAYQSNTSIPTDPTLSIASLPALTAYVGQFGGYMSDKVEQEETTKLKNAMTKYGVQFVQQYSFAAGYDPPFRVIGRHNEVWLIGA